MVTTVEFRIRTGNGFYPNKCHRNGKCRKRPTFSLFPPPAEQDTRRIRKEPTVAKTAEKADAKRPAESSAPAPVMREIPNQAKPHDPARDSALSRAVQQI